MTSSEQVALLREICDKYEDRFGNPMPLEIYIPEWERIVKRKWTQTLTK